MRLSKLLPLLAPGLFLMLHHSNAQTVIFNNPGTSYNNTDVVTTNNYGPVNISNCTSISFSVQYNFSLGFPGSGNMESSSECGGCAGDPNDPYTGGCSNCWDFFYAQFQVDGVNVNTQLIGVPGFLNQSGTLTFGPICVPTASTADIIIQTNTWAANETITFSNITVTCWDASSNLMVNPNPVCSGLPFNLGATLTNPASVMGTVWTGPGTIASPNSLNTTVTNAPVGTSTYTFTATDDNACTASNTIDVTVNQAPTVDDPPNITVCADDPVQVPFTGTVNPTVSWTNSNPAIGLGASGMGDLNFTAAMVASAQTGNITITPMENGCPGPSQNFTITVNPQPVVNQPPNVSVCAGAPVVANFTGTAGATFSWSNDNPAIGLGASGNGNINFNSANVAAQEVANITVTPMIGTCMGMPVTFTVTVNPGPTVMDPPNENICAGEQLDIAFSGTINPVFNWTNTNPAIGLGANGTGDISFVGANVVAATTGTITVTPNEAGCPGGSQTFTITVNPMPMVNQPADVSVCAGAAVVRNFTGTAGATFSWTNDNPAIGLGASGNGNINFNTANVAAQEVATITVTPMIGICMGTPVTFTVTVNPGPTVIDPANENICAGEQLDVAFSGTINPVFNWTNNNPAIGLGANGTGDISFVGANVVAATTGTITVTPNEAGCPGPSQTFTVTVNPMPSVNQPANVSVCAGAPVVRNFTGTAGATFSWTNDNPAIGLGASGNGNLNFVSANVAGQELANITVTPMIGTCMGNPLTFTVTVNPAPTVVDPPNQSICSGEQVDVLFSGSVNPVFNWTNNNPAIGLGPNGTGDISFSAANVFAATTATITVTPNEGGCPGPAQTFTVIVNPMPSVNQPGDVSVCAGAPVSANFTGSGGATFSWTNDNPAIGVGVSGNGNLNFISANVAAQEVANITVTPMIGTCMGNPLSFTVTVNPAPTVLDPANQSICSGEVVEVFFSGTVNPVFTWTNNNPAIGLGPNGTGDISFSAANVFATTTGTITVTPNEGGCPGPAQTFTLTINPVPAVNQPGDVAVCAGAPVATIFTGTAGATYTWTNDNPAIGLANTGNGNLNFISANVAAQEVANITVTPLINGCPGSAQNFLITVNPAPTVLDEPNQSVCSGSAIAVAFSGTNNPTFNWVNSNPAIGLAAIGSGDISFTAGSAGTATITVTPNENGCPGASQMFDISVVGLPVLSQPMDLSACAGTVVSNIFTGTAGATFIWTNSDPAIGLAANGTGNISFTAANVATSTTATISVIPSLGTCAGAAQNFDITIDPLPTIGIVSVDCSPDLLTYAISLNSSGTNISASAGTVSGSSGNYTITNIPAGTNVTISSSIAATSCQVQQSVNAPNCNCLPVAAPNGANMVICEGASNPALTVITAPGTTVDWYAASTGGSPLLSGNASYTPPGLLMPGVYSYYAEARDISTNCTSAIRFEVTLTVNAVPAVTVSSDQNVCAGDQVVLNFTGSSGATLDWTNSNTTIGLGAGGNGNISFLSVNSGNAPVTSNLVVTPSQNGCTGAAQSFTVTVNPTPVLSAPANQTYCAGTPVAINFSGTNGANVDWANSNPAIGLGASGSGNISFVAAVVSTPTSASLTATPALAGCTGLSQAFTININPLPTVDLMSDTSVCTGETVMLPFSGTNGAVFDWTNSNPAIGLGANGTGDINFTGINTGNTVVLGNLVVTPVQNSCSGLPQNFSITVNPLPALTLDSIDCAADLSNYAIYVSSNANTLTSNVGTVTSNGSGFQISNIPAGSNALLTINNTATGCSQQLAVNAPNCNCAPVSGATSPNFPVVCEGAPVPALMVTASAGTTIDWYQNPSGGSPLLLGSSSYMPQGPLTPGVYRFYAEARDPSTSCTSLTRVEVTLTVNPLPNVAQPLDQSVCVGTTISVNFSGSASATLNWTNSNPGIGLGANGNGNINFSAVNSGMNPLTANLAVTPILNGCAGNAQNFVITVNPIPAVIISGNTNLCFGDVATLTASGGTTVNWSTGANTAAIDVNPLTTSTYTATVTANGCANSSSVTVNVLQPSTATVNAVTCDPAQVGTVISTTPNAAGCDSTIITITTLDNSTCIPAPLLSNGTVSCFGNSDGILTLSASNGVSPYQYNWSNGVQTGSGTVANSGASVQLQNLSAGTYTVTITGANGLSSTVSTIVGSPAVLTAQATAQLQFGQQALSCFGASDAAIQGSTTGGTGPFQYDWSIAGQNSPVLSGIGAGIYQLTVTDAHLCTAISSATIVDPPEMLLDVVLAGVRCGESNAIAQITPTNGVQPFSVSVDGAPAGGDLTPSLPVGTHLIEVSDTYGCTADTMLNVLLADVPTISLPAEVNVSLGETLVLEAQTNLTDWQNLVWHPTPDTSCPHCLRQEWKPDFSGIYEVVITDSAGCSASTSVRVIVANRINLYVPNVFAPNSGGLNDFWTIQSGLDDLNLKTLLIFDRWGDLVYSLDGKVPVNAWPGWDGMYRGDPVNPGVFVYYLEVELGNGEVVKLKGDLTVVR